MADPTTPTMTREQFVERFIAHMIFAAGFTHFDDGTPVADYARETAGSYWDAEDQREDGPEECAEGDIDCWER